jgi:serine protease Do
MNTTLKKVLPVSLLVPALVLSGCEYLPLPTETQTKTYTKTEVIESPNQTVVYKDDFSDMVEKCKSSVVAITTEASYFGFFGTYTQSGAGSGFILDKSGIIVTNNHVIEGATTVNVILDDGRTFQAKKVYGDAITDIAVVFIDAEDLTPVSIGNPDKLKVGNWVFNIGNALGIGISASEGIVSAKDVTLNSEGTATYGLIQTTAAINPGNSGGPMFNTNGEVVGITSSKMSAVGVESMGYAISMNEAIPIIEQLIDNGKVIRPDLGAELYTVTSSIARRYQLAVNSGALVTSVSNGGVADKAGIRIGDVIVKVDDTEIKTASAMTHYLQNKEIGSTIKITYYHGNTMTEATVTLVNTTSK